MKTGQTRTFGDPKVLKKMLKMREQGMRVIDIAKKFKCDHSSIVYQCQKYYGIGKVHEKNKIRIAKRIKIEKIVKFRRGFCRICEMKLSSSWHKENPCLEENLVKL